MRAILDKHGIAYTPMRGGKHDKLKTILGGQKVVFVMSRSPSDSRALTNQYHQTRQKLISAGVAWQECKELIHD
ncbi:hypothetical protein [Sphingomonas faeni]|uniref:hypothetical protein n=1 Tax=Sphingomonas faeni TaxID=185950 RepID=UPI000D37F2F1|nr:hypothetical protein [Sphingomonas faeni]